MKADIYFFFKKNNFFMLKTEFFIYNNYSSDFYSLSFPRKGAAPAVEALAGAGNSGGSIRCGRVLRAGSPEPDHRWSPALALGQSTILLECTSHGAC